MLTNEVTLITSHNGVEATQNTSYGKISGNGQYVVFANNAALIPGDTNGNSDIFMRDL
jgi:hypothetical protein